jgi:molecular chaperone IbpA
MLPSNLQSWDQYLIGVDHLLKLMDQATQTSQGGYPPHNVIRRDQDHYAIELAVAGFGEEDLNIVQHNGTLSVTGDIKEVPVV